MSIVIKEVQVDWDVTTSLKALKDLGLDTNAGAISTIPVDDDQVKICTLDKSQFERWCAALKAANYSFTVATPAGH